MNKKLIIILITIIVISMLVVVIILIDNDILPSIENYYWIFTNRSHGVENKHSVDELLEDGMYYAISFGILDIDNCILYYYEYDK
ncbi:MAG: hypothetical protein J6O41_05935 [Clostridia bacterium]|nr:hypothetical protein [Clostridia bacterium]